MISFLFSWAFLAVGSAQIIARSSDECLVVPIVKTLVLTLTGPQLTSTAHDSIATSVISISTGYSSSLTISSPPSLATQQSSISIGCDSISTALTSAPTSHPSISTSRPSHSTRNLPLPSTSKHPTISTTSPATTLITSHAWNSTTSSAVTVAASGASNSTASYVTTSSASYAWNSTTSNAITTTSHAWNTTTSYAVTLSIPVASNSTTSYASTSTRSSASNVTTTQIPTSSAICAADNCFASASLLPAFSPVASAFCEDFIHASLSTVVATVTATALSTVIPAQSDVTVSITEIVTITAAQTCTTTITTSLPTSVFYASRGVPAAIQRRDPVPYPSVPTLPAIPSQLSSGCDQGSLPAKISSACSCFLKPTTSIVTQTISIPVTGAAPEPTTSTSIVSGSTTISLCESYSTQYVYSGSFSCGIANPTIASASGQITCTSPAPAGETNGRLRIEGGNEGTVFEDCVSSGPEQVTTPSGGTHECDGTNNNANPNPGATCTTQLLQAAEQYGFPFDGTYASQFQDFFITSIDSTSQTDSQFWGLLQDESFTPSGGCQEEIAPGGTQETLWAFDAFNANAFLSVTPEYMVVTARTETVQVFVSSNDGNGYWSPYRGATIEGGGVGVSSVTGSVSIVVPSTSGCYQYKATAPGAIRSNAFYLTVLPASQGDARRKVI